jgi:Holliday junction DNA helicase RuvB
VITTTSENPLIPDLAPAPDELRFEVSLRPGSLADFVGQQQLKHNLSITIQAAQLRGDKLEHILLYGPPGLGKTTLAHIVARELNTNIKITTGPAIERAGDLAALLSNLSEGDVLFIDEIHRLHKTIEEVLYPAMEDGVLDIMVGKGPGARSLRMDLPKFTLIGATTRLGLLSAPLRDRFGSTYQLQYYEAADLEHIVGRTATLLETNIEPEASSLIARRSRYTPRIANRLLKRVRDFAQVAGHATISAGLVDTALTQLGVDSYGLDHSDRRILEVIIEQFNGGPVGLSSIAASTGEDPDTIAEVNEPFLIRAGLLVRTPKGRKATTEAYTHLGKTPPLP